MPDLGPHTRLYGWLALIALAVGVAAWSLPVGVASSREALSGDVESGATPILPPPEDLTAFLDGTRWGVSLREINERIADERSNQSGKGLNPAVRELGYVGLVEVNARTETVLLTAPDGKVARLRPGDRVADGRLLAAVGPNSITLRAGEAEEVLTLFPRFANEAARQEVE